MNQSLALELPVEAQRLCCLKCQPGDAGRAVLTWSHPEDGFVRRKGEQPGGSAGHSRARHRRPAHHAVPAARERRDHPDPGPCQLDLLSTVGEGGKEKVLVLPVSRALL